MSEEYELKKEFEEMEKAYKNMFDNITLEQFKQVKEQVTKNIKSKDKEIDEILDNLKYVSNDIKAHIKDGNIIGKEIPSSMIKELRLNSYSANILLDYITSLQQKVEQLENIRKEAIEYIRNNFQQNIITGSEYLIGYSPCTDLLNILNKGSE